TYLAQDLGAALGTQAVLLPAAPLPVPDRLDPDTSRALDAARYALEVVAARTAGEVRAAAVARAGHLQEVASAVAPEEDRREVAYDITAAREAGERDLAALAELDVVRAYVALPGTADTGREVVLAAAVHAAGEARRWGATLPPLPGLSSPRNGDRRRVRCWSSGPRAPGEHHAPPVGGRSHAAHRPRAGRHRRRPLPRGRDRRGGRPPQRRPGRRRPARRPRRRRLRHPRGRVPGDLHRTGRGRRRPRRLHPGGLHSRGGPTADDGASLPACPGPAGAAADHVRAGARPGRRGRR